MLWLLLDESIALKFSFFHSSQPPALSFALLLTTGQLSHFFIDTKGSKLRVTSNGKRSGGIHSSGARSMNCFPNQFTSARLGARHPGLHDAIVDRELWESTKLLLRSHTAQGVIRARKTTAIPLVGKLFDESGQTLTPSHTVKGDRSYRYLRLAQLTAGPQSSERSGWRLPAPEIECTVASAACTILSDRTAIAEAAHSVELAESASLRSFRWRCHG
jgi:hypothetical protein